MKIIYKDGGVLEGSQIVLDMAYGLAYVDDIYEIELDDIEKIEDSGED